jgi:dTDP-4-dehydrorhamnose 3,5-epimerase-like enzyme
VVIENLPKLIKGATHVDHRGLLIFNNELNLSRFERAYTIQNSDDKPFRGWHGHQIESKLFLTVAGKIRFGAVRVSNWSEPDPNESVFTAEIKAPSMDAFFVPGGFANGILSLEPGSQALVFSSSSLSDSLSDDFRIDADLWRI